MLLRITTGCIFLLGMPLWAQVGVLGASETEMISRTKMAIPAPISDQPYPTVTGDEVHSNYLAGGVVVEGGYIDNLLAGSTASPISEETISIRPTVHLDQSSTRLHRLIEYSPGFTFYQPSTQLNEIDQDANLNFEFQLSPHAVLNLRDSLQKSSNSFSQASYANAVAASAQPSAPNILTPYAQQLQNTARGQFAWQTARTTMIGVSGFDSILHFPLASQVPGLYDSHARAGSAFYSHEASPNQYLGAIYQYADTLSSPTDGESVTKTQTFYGFYSLYAGRHFSANLSAGPEKYETRYLKPGPSGWEPAVWTSVGLQAAHVSFAANFGRQITGGSGLLGAFRTSQTEASARWVFSREWAAGLTANYVMNKGIDPLQSLGEPGGHTVSGTATVEHWLSLHLLARLEYDRVHTSYPGIVALASNPDSNRVAGSISWRFSKALGR